MPYSTATVVQPQLTSVTFDTINGLSLTPIPSPSHKIPHKKLLPNDNEQKLSSTTMVIVEAQYVSSFLGYFYFWEGFYLVEFNTKFPKIFKFISQDLFGPGLNWISNKWYVNIYFFWGCDNTHQYKCWIYKSHNDSWNLILFLWVKPMCQM